MHEKSEPKRKQPKGNTNLLDELISYQKFSFSTNLSIGEIKERLRLLRDKETKIDIEYVSEGYYQFTKHIHRDSRYAPISVHSEGTIILDPAIETAYVSGWVRSSSLSTIIVLGLTVINLWLFSGLFQGLPLTSGPILLLIFECAYVWNLHHKRSHLIDELTEALKPEI